MADEAIGRGSRDHGAGLADSPSGGRGLCVRELAVDFRLKGKTITALETVSLDLRAGGFAGVIGPSGCGKSTLLRVIADLVSPTSGSVMIEGKTPSDLRRAQEIGFVFQEPTLLPWRSVIENIRLPLILRRDRGTAPREPQELVNLVGLSGFENAVPAQLSGGMQQRVAIARALSLNPKILLLDEPFGALDEITRQRMNLELLRIWSDSERTALLVTHSIAEAVFMADRVFVMSARPGRIVAKIEVPLPRPRELEMMGMAAFFETVNKVRSALFDGDANALTAGGYDG